MGLWSRRARLTENTTCAAMPVNDRCPRSRSRNMGQLNTTSQPPAAPHEPNPGFGPGPPRLTSRSGAGTGSGCSRSWSKSEKMAAFAPMPSARDTTATVVTNGVLIRARSASFTLDMGISGPLGRKGGRRWDTPTARRVARWRGGTSRGPAPDPGGVEERPARGGIEETPAGQDGVDSPGISNVGERIGVEQDQVRDLSRLDGSQRILRAEESGRVERRGAEHLERREPRPDQPGELLMQPEPRRAVPERRVGAGEDADARPVHLAHQGEALREDRPAHTVGAPGHAVGHGEDSRDVAPE